MGKLQHTDSSIVYYLIELLTFNNHKLSAAVTELLWNIFTMKSNFLASLNNIIVLDAKEQIFLLNKSANDKFNQNEF